jgi:hypothetical protein
MRTLAYWKARKVDLHNNLLETPRNSPYYAELWRAWRYADDKIQKIEHLVLVKQ